MQEISPFYFILLCCQSRKKRSRLRFTFGPNALIHFESFVCRFETIFRPSILLHLFYVPEIFQEKSGNRRVVLFSLSLSLYFFLPSRFVSLEWRKKKKRKRLKWIASRREETPLERLEKKVPPWEQWDRYSNCFCKEEKSVESIERTHLETFSLSLFFDSKQWLFSLPPIQKRNETSQGTIYHRILSTPFRYRID